MISDFEMLDFHVFQVFGQLAYSGLYSSEFVLILSQQEIQPLSFTTTKDTEILLTKNMTLICIFIWTFLCCCFTESRGQVTVTQSGAVSSALEAPSPSHIKPVKMFIIALQTTF